MPLGGFDDMSSYPRLPMTTALLGTPVRMLEINSVGQTELLFMSLCRGQHKQESHLHRERTERPR